jgi:putative DNA topoisomerase
MSAKKNDSTPALFNQHEHALEKAYEVCPMCGAELHLKNSKSGPFWGCSQYPVCTYTRALNEQERIEDQVLAGSECPECGSLLAVKQGRYGIFIGCTNYPECHHIEEEKPKEALVACPKCKKGELQERISRFGKTFYSCDQYPSCKYIVNYPPVAQTCPECAWPILVKRQMAKGEILMCPQKKCTYKSNTI